VEEEEQEEDQCTSRADGKLAGGRHVVQEERLLRAAHHIRAIVLTLTGQGKAAQTGQLTSTFGLSAHFAASLSKF